MLASIQLAAFWPGVMIWDAIRQYGQALTGQYDDWHPPAMNWLWRQLLVCGPGPAPMFVLQLVLYWTGLALLCDWALEDDRPRLAVSIAACALLPAPFLLLGSVIKDCLMASALLLATGLIARRPFGARWSGVAAAMLLLAAATLRFNAAPACLPLAIVALPRAWRTRRWQLAATAIGAAIPLALALPLANLALRAGKSGVEQSLVIYDLAGITRFSGDSMLPPVGVAAAATVISECYSPREWDRYAWWGAEPCAIGFTNVGAAFRKGGDGPWATWARAILRHPLAYAWHRLLHFNSEERFVVSAGEDAAIPIASDPNPWGFAVTPGRVYRLVTLVGKAALQTPLGWPACWLALGLGLLGLISRTGSAIALPLLVSGLLYDLSFLPLGVASEIRYRFWPMTAVAIAAAILLSDRAIPPRRRAAATMPALFVAAIGASARAMLG